MEVDEAERRMATVTVKKRSDVADESIPSGWPDSAASRCLVPLQSLCGYESNGPARDKNNNMNDKRRKNNMNVPDSLDTWKLTTSKLK